MGPAEQSTVDFRDLPKNEKLVEIYLSQRVPVTITKVEIEKDHPGEDAQCRRIDAGDDEEETEAAVCALETDGDDRLLYIDGLRIFGADALEHLPDQLHPDAEGYRIMARNFKDTVVPLFEKTLQS